MSMSISKFWLMVKVYCPLAVIGMYFLAMVAGVSGVVADMLGSSLTAPLYNAALVCAGLALVIISSMAWFPPAKEHR
jgi:hypothetical protein